VADATWLADLLAHGLIRASFVPEPATQELRALLRTRKQLVREQASHIQRIQKTLEDANLKLSSVLSNIMGLSGRAILKALIDGAEIGIDMSRFPTAGHLISWAGLCPRNDESAGKRRSNRLRKGAPWLKTTLVQCAPAFAGASSGPGPVKRRAI
jgi:transposase